MKKSNELKKLKISLIYPNNEAISEIIKNQNKIIDVIQDQEARIRMLEMLNEKEELKEEPIPYSYLPKGSWQMQYGVEKEEQKECLHDFVWSNDMRIECEAKCKKCGKNKSYVEVYKEASEKLKESVYFTKENVIKLVKEWYENNAEKWDRGYSDFIVKLNALKQPQENTEKFKSRLIDEFDEYFE